MFVDTEPGLPAYSGPRAGCVKCGAGEAGTVFYASGRCVHGNDDHVIDTHAGFPNPRLHRTCLRCGYSWDERTRDSQEVAG